MSRILLPHCKARRVAAMKAIAIPSRPYTFHSLKWTWFRCSSESANQSSYVLGEWAINADVEKFGLRASVVNRFLHEWFRVSVEEQNENEKRNLEMLLS